MPLQLTPEQEQRIKTVVLAGAYVSAEEALEAAVAAVELAAAPGFDGSQEELEGLLLDGISSGKPVEADEAFWNRLRVKTGKIAATHQELKDHR